MKKRRQALSLILALVMALALLPASALAAAAEESARCKYDMIDEFSDGMARVAVQVGTEQTEYDGEVYESPVYQCGFIDQTGAEVIAPQYSRAENFSDGLALVYEGNQAHFIDKTGAQVSIKMEYPCYVFGTGFHNGLFAVYRERDDLEEPGYYCGYVDKTGKEVIPCIYDDIEDFSEGLARVGIGEGSACRFGFIDTTGKEVAALKYDSASPQFSDGFAQVELDGKYGVIDKTGKEVVPCKYDTIGDISGNLAEVGTDSGETDEWGNIIYQWSVVDMTTGKEVVPGENAGFSEGLAPVQKDGKWGFMDEAGKVVIPCKYDIVDRFSEGLARVANYYDYEGDGELYPIWGYIDQTGKEVIPLVYAEADNFSGGLAYVCYPRSAEWEVIDLEGHPVARFNQAYSGAREFLVNAFAKGFIVNVGTYEPEMVFVDQTTKEQTSVHGYVEMRSLSGNYAAVAVNWDDPHWGIIDLTGKQVVPCQYSNVYALAEGLVNVEKDGKCGVVNIRTGKEVVPCVYDRIESFSGSQVKVGMESGRKDEWGDPIYKWGIVAAAPVVVSTGIDPEASGTAVSMPQKVQVGDQTVELQTYALTGNGGLTNYVKLRDLADILDGTAAQFDVTWSKEAGVGIETGTPYTSRNGTEGVTNYTGNQAYQRSAATTNVDGVAVELQCFALQNGAYTYYKLRDLGQALNFNVGWSQERGVFIEPDQPYDPNN